MISDYIIIGGGTIGCSLAYQLSCYGKKVTVLEKKDTASGAAGASGSLSGIFGHERGPGFDLVRASVAMIPEVVRNLDLDVGFKNDTDYLQCICNDMEMKIADAIVDKYVFGDVHAEIIDIKDTLRIEPAVNPELKGAIYVPDMKYLDPIKLAFGFRKRASENGAVFVNEVNISKFIYSGNSVCGVATDKGDYYADGVIISAGAWSGEVGKMAGIEIPVKPFRSEMIVTEPTGPLVMGEIGSCTLEAVWYYPALITDERILENKISFAIEQTDTGTCIIHGSREDAGFNKTLSPFVMELILQIGCEIVPALRKLKMIRSFCGFRPVSEDNMPYMGPVSKVPGLFLCTGHGASGITMSCASGKAMAELIVEGRSRTADLSAFTPDRIRKEA